MKKAEIFKIIENILAETQLLETDVLRADTLQNDIGLDSLDVVEFGMNLEKEFNIHITDEVYDDLHNWNVGQVVNYVANKVQ